MTRFSNIILKFPMRKDNRQSHDLACVAEQRGGREREVYIDHARYAIQKLVSSDASRLT